MTETHTVEDLKDIAKALDLAYWEDQRITEAQEALATLVEVWTTLAALPEFRNAGEYILACFFCDYTGSHEPGCLWVRAQLAVGKPAGRE